MIFVDDSERGHLLSLNKDTEVPVTLPFSRRSKLLTANVFIQYVLCQCPWTNFRKIGIWVNKQIKLFRKCEKHEHFKQN